MSRKRKLEIKDKDLGKVRSEEKVEELGSNVKTVATHSLSEKIAKMTETQAREFYDSHEARIGYLRALPRYRRGDEEFCWLCEDHLFTENPDDRSPPFFMHQSPHHDDIMYCCMKCATANQIDINLQMDSDTFETENSKCCPKCMLYTKLVGEWSGLPSVLASLAADYAASDRWHDVDYKRHVRLEEANLVFEQARKTRQALIDEIRDKEGRVPDECLILSVPNACPSIHS